MKKLVCNIGILILLLTQVISATSVDQDIVQSQSDIKTQSLEIENLETEINSLDQDISSLESDITFAQEESSQLEIRNTEIKKEIEKLNIEIEEKTSSNGNMLSYLQELRTGNEIISVLFSNDSASSFQSAFALNFLIEAMNEEIQITVQKINDVKKMQKEVEFNAAIIKENIATAQAKKEEVQEQKSQIIQKKNESYEKADQLKKELAVLQEQQKAEIIKQQESIIVENVDVDGSHKDWMAAANISESDYHYVEYIVSVESGWNYQATNPYSGAYGLCQALPGAKMQSAGSDWKTNPVTQLIWCNEYAISRYSSWENAYNFWSSNHWW